MNGNESRPAGIRAAGKGTHHRAAASSEQDFTPIPLFVCGRRVGEIRGRVLWKRINAAHYLQRPPSIAWAVQVLRTAEASGVEVCEVEDADTGLVRRAPLSAFWTRGFAIQRGGFEEQRALPLKSWATGGELEAEPVVQLSFLGEAAR